MKLFSFFPALTILSMITSCSWLLPSTELMAPRSLVGYKMDASGLEGSYHYEFLGDDTYRRIKIFPSGRRSSVKTGEWKWERTSGNFAILTLDQVLEIKLHFTTHDHANATVPNSDRLFPIEFRKPVER